jgi:hypothetical protein
VLVITPQLEYLQCCSACECAAARSSSKRSKPNACIAEANKAQLYIALYIARFLQPLRSGDRNKI